MKQSAHSGKPRTLLWSILTAVCAILLIAAPIASYVAFGAAQAINIALHIDTYKVENKNEDAVYFECDFASVEALEAHDKEVAEQLTGEGAVLLRNDNNALPLKNGAAVSLFSRSSADIATCGTGSANIDTSKAPSLKEALEEAGLSVNPILWDFYTVGDGSSYVRTPVKGMNGLEDNDRSNYHINEVPVSAYTADVILRPGRFQSTLPLRGATDRVERAPSSPVISIHAPLAGSDFNVHTPVLKHPYFNPRSPCGERHPGRVLSQAQAQISIHAPLAGSDGARSTLSVR